jgi:AspT/YidE/YbjL antiporter-like protein
VEWLVEALQEFPEVSIFLVLALGYSMGSLRVGSFSLGPVTGTLLMGVLVGQMRIAISPSVKATCFLIFLFFVGYSVGPRFFQGLRRDGLPQVLFAAVQCIISLATGYVVAKAFGYDVGQAAGLLAGSQTISALLGTATDAINKLSIPSEEKRRLLDAMTVAYAVTYIFGTAGTAWILSALGPRLVGGDVAAACRGYEGELTSKPASDPETAAAFRQVAASARELTSSGAAWAAPEDREPAFPRRSVFAAPSRSAAPLVMPRRADRLPVSAVAYAPRPAGANAVILVASGITVGGLAGALALRAGEVPLSLTTSGGTLLAGLVFGWVRSRYHILEDVPEPALVTMNSVGLNIFIAVVGINAGPGFIAGLAAAGPSLLVAGMFVTAIPLIVGLLLARHVFGFHPGIALGCVAGARTAAPALGAVQDVVQSKVPGLGYTIPYAIGNTILTIWGIAIVTLMG